MNIVWFTLIQLLNVITSTIKSIVTIQSKPIVAGVINAFYYTLYYGVIKLIVNQDLYIVLIISFITNIIGVPLAKYIMKLAKKDNLWVYNIILYGSENDALTLKSNLKNKNIKSMYDDIQTNKMYNVKAFSNSKDDSTIILNALEFYKCDYFIVKCDN